MIKLPRSEPLSAPQVRALAQALEATRPTEIDCDAFLALLPALTETRRAGHLPPATLADAVAHERLCANCREEAAALLAALES